MTIVDTLNRLRSAFFRKCNWHMARQRISESGSTGCTVRVTHGDTGRSYDFSGADAEQVVSWTRCESTRQLLQHPYAELFRQYLRSSPLLGAEELVAFRGRFRDQEMYPKVQSFHFGPPPPNNTNPGRYNIAGKPVLYLSSSEEGVLHEMRRGEEPVKDLFCQRFRIPVNGLRIADFSQNSTVNFVNIVFAYAERGTRPGQVDRSDYRFSQVVARLVQESGFDGMTVPGVRGGLECKYTNVVIFRAHTYTGWLDHNSEPQCIDGLDRQVQQDYQAPTNRPPD